MNHFQLCGFLSNGLEQVICNPYHPMWSGGDLCCKVFTLVLRITYFMREKKNSLWLPFVWLQINSATCLVVMNISERHQWNPQPATALSDGLFLGHEFFKMCQLKLRSCLPGLCSPLDHSASHALYLWSRP